MEKDRMDGDLPIPVTFISAVSMANCCMVCVSTFMDTITCRYRVKIIKFLVACVFGEMNSGNVWAAAAVGQVLDSQSLI